MKNREIIDNSEDRKLVTYLKEKLKENNDGFDVATAFFNIEAFSMVKEELDGVDHFRLLLGKTPEFDNDRTLGDEIQDYLESDVAGLEFSKENHEAVESLIEFLDQDNVEVRLYDENFLHGKAYIWDDEVIIGSSNFTAAGLASNNELNGIFKTQSKAEYTRREWFDKFWNQSIEFNEELIELLEKSRFGSKEYDPYEVFMKTLYEYQRKDLDKAFEDESRRNSRVDLTEFQEDAVNRVFTRMEKYGGCMVADSVGLGKTYVAKRVIEHFGASLKRNFLIVSPASLEGMWKEEMKDMGISENIVTQEAIARDNYLYNAEKATGKKLEDVELIVVDESHNFRNPESNRWENLFTLMNEHIDGDGKKPYVLFLTATPINNTIWDLYWQLMLMLEMDRTAFLKEGITDLFQEFEDVEEAGDPSLLNDLLNEISVRRTRDYIQKNYPDAAYEDDEGNEIKLKFPDRKLNDLRYELDDAYQGYFEYISKKIKNDLTMAYYRLLEYKKTGELTQEEELQLGRMKGLEGIFQKLLLKRLESSVGAFKKSIDNHIDFLERLERNVNTGNILTKKTYRKHIMEVEEEISEEEFEEELEDFDKDKFNTENFVEDLKKDIVTMKDIRDKISDIGPEEDTKLKKLEKELEELAEDQQAIVFAFYSDTIQYVHNYLQQSEMLQDKNIAKITGNTSTREREKIIEQYMDQEIDVILSTDVLSEGQNLQSAKHLINYDLHWNPTRMIQRAGRIDRIGTPHEEIIIHNFFPSDELEELLELVKALEGKISDIDKSIGLDQKVLDEEINPKVFGTASTVSEEQIRRISENDSSIFEEQEETQFGGGEDLYQPIKTYIEQSGRAELDKIPNGIYSGHQDGVRGVFFYYKYGEDFHYWYLYDIENDEFLDNKSKIQKFIATSPDENREIPEFFEEVYDVSAQVRDKIESDYKEVEQASTDDRFKEWNADRATKFIPKMIRELTIRLDEHMYEFPEDYETEQKIEDIESKLREVTLTKKRVKQIRRFWRSYKSKNGHGDWMKLADDLESFLDDKSKDDRQNIEPFDPEKLKLITVEFIS